MAEEPLVSIIMPAYQAEATVGAAISSALTQTYGNIEIVVCNDGSSDGTKALLDAHGGRLTVVDQENRGLPSARNAAIEASSGELLSLLDSDDVLLPSHVEEAVTTWQRAGGGRRFVTSNALPFSDQGLFPGDPLLGTGTPADPATQRRWILQRNYISIFSTFPRALYDEIGGYDPEMRLLEDWDLWSRAIFSGWEVLFQTHPTALYRRSSGQLSAQHERMAQYTRRLREKLSQSQRDSMTASERAFLDMALTMEPASFYIKQGEDALGAGDRQGALDAFRKASTLLPDDRRIRLKAEALRLPPLAALYARRTSSPWR